MKVDWSAKRTIERFHIQFFNISSITLKENLEDANIFIIRRLLQLANGKDTQTQILRVILANQLVVSEKEFKPAPGDNVDDLEP